MSLFEAEQLWAANGVARTNSLFTETSRPGDEPIMSLNGGNKSVPCLRELYVPLVAADPSEVSFAEGVFGDLRYWLKLRNAKFMPQYLEDWEHMAAVKRKQAAFEAIINEVKTQGRSSFTAAKYLIEEPWKDKRDPKVSKANKDSTSEAKEYFNEDIIRLKDAGVIR